MHGTGDGGDELGRQIWAQTRERRRLCLVDQHGQVRQGRRLEGPPTRRALVQNHSQGIDIDTRVDDPSALQLLGRHIKWRADQRTIVGERAHALGFLELRNPEIQNLQERSPLALGDEQVLRLQVAMNDARFVSGRDAVAGLQGEVHQLRGVDRPTSDALCQCLSV